MLILCINNVVRLAFKCLVYIGYYAQLVGEFRKLPVRLWDDFREMLNFYIKYVKSVIFITQALWN